MQCPKFVIDPIQNPDPRNPKKLRCLKKWLDVLLGRLGFSKKALILIKLKGMHQD
jgi:hypothetical protein